MNISTIQKLIVNMGIGGTHIPLMMVGEMGIGKSWLIKDAAAYINKKLRKKAIKAEKLDEDDPRVLFHYIDLRLATQEPGDITGIPWNWEGLIETAPAAQSVVPDPENYMLILQPDGTLDIKADCNVVGGSYTLEGDSLTIGLGPSTMAYCGEQSLDLQYLELLSNVDGYTIKGDQLVLNLTDDAGNMVFIPTEK